MIYINVTTTCATDSIILIQNILAIVVKGKHVDRATTMETEGLVSGVGHWDSPYVTSKPLLAQKILLHMLGCREVAFIF
jgi:hypothetical protein